MKSIDTLVEDIYDLFQKDYQIPEDHIVEFGQTLAKHISNRVTEHKVGGKLRMSMLGMPLRKLWYSINTPELGEPLDGKTRFKFLYGDILEALVLFLAKQAGHTVQGEQDEIAIDGVLGHRDAILDGRLVDIKSASPYGFAKFQNHNLEKDDPFGYLEQINAYLFASKDDPALLDKEKVAFLAIEKVNGNITLDTYYAKNVDYAQRIKEIRTALQQPRPPERCYPDKPMGSSGNRVLGVECSYCPFKQACWPNLRAYYYSRGPVYFTHIEKEPRVEKATWNDTDAPAVPVREEF